MSHTVSYQDIWARSIGALGEQAWRRLVTLHVGIVGCGRTGSLVAGALRRSGVSQITLVDPDRLEPHNLGEMNGVDLRDLGRPKVKALAESLARQELVPELSIYPLATTVVSSYALVAVKPVDLMICSVDNPAARWVTACLAALYLKPLLDLSSGIFGEAHLGSPQPSLPRADPGDSSLRQMGADVRLVLPGRCLICYGGIADIERARRELSPRAAGDPATAAAPIDWQVERAGSLRSLNSLGVSLGLRLLEDLLAGRLTESAWLRVEYDETGIPSIERLAARAASATNSRAT